MDTVIEFRGVRKAYGEHVVLDDFSLSVERGSFVTVIGASGGGKTTALKMVNGLIAPDSGKVLVNGADVAEKNLVELRRSIGYAIQGSVLFPHMTVEQNIAYVPNLINRRDHARTAAAVGKWMGITVLFVTHDISEALRLGTRVLVIDGGRIQQYAEPSELLRAPATDFVRRLVARERRLCHLPDDQLADCEFSGAGDTKGQSPCIIGEE